MDLLCSGEPACCRIILAHFYCHGLEALQQLGYKPLFCWAWELQITTHSMVQAEKAEAQRQKFDSPCSHLQKQQHFEGVK